MILQLFVLIKKNNKLSSKKWQQFYANKLISNLSKRSQVFMKNRDRITYYKAPRNKKNNEKYFLKPIYSLFHISLIFVTTTYF